MERTANLNNNEFIFATLGSKWTENHKGYYLKYYTVLKVMHREASNVKTRL
jgi:hypothetical protein